MERLIEDAELERPSQVDAATAARMVRPYTWLLNWVGPEGIRLTEAGHLPPAQVTEAMCELNLAADGHGRRENQVRGVRQLRESAQAMGLLRKQRRQLLLTARAGELRSDPAALWWHLAERMPLRSAAAGEVQPGLVLLICVAARSTDTLHATIARMLSAIGWMNSDGSPLSGEDAARVTSCTEAVLRRLGALAEDPCPGYAPWPTPEGVAFARAALRTWPRAGGLASAGPPLPQQPGGRLGLAVAGEHALVVAARPVHRLRGGEVGEVPHVLADDLRDPAEDP